MRPGSRSKAGRRVTSAQEPTVAVTLNRIDNHDDVAEQVIMVGGMYGANRGSGGSSDVESHARRKNFGMRPYVISTTVFSILLLIVLAVYYAIVFLNLTFTFDNLALTDVPFYKEPHPSSTALWKLANRYGVWWILVALSLPRIGSVVGSNMAVSNTAISGQEFPLSFMRTWLFIYGIADLAIGIFYIITAFSKMCSEVPVCRDWTSVPTDTDVGPNWTFLLHTLFTVAFAGVHVAYYFVMGSAIQKLEREVDKIEVEEDTKGP